MKESSTLLFSDIAVHFGRHLNKEDSATQYLLDNGVVLSKESVVSDSSIDDLAGKQERIRSEQSARKVNNEEQTQKTAPLNFPVYCVTHKETRIQGESAPWHISPYDIDSEKPKVKMPKKDEVEPFSSLIDKLRVVLCQPQNSQKIDVKPLVNKAARQDVIDPIPYLEKPQQPEKLWLFIDKGPDLNGFHQDAFILKRRLKQFWPETSISTFSFPHGPDGEWWGASGKAHFTPLPTPREFTCILLITGESKGTVQAWRPVINKMQSKGANIFWLSPVAPDTQIRYELPAPVIVWGEHRNQQKRPFSLLVALLMTMRIIPGPLLRALIKKLRMPAGFELQFWQLNNTHYWPDSDMGRIEIISQKDKNKLEEQLQALSAELLSDLNHLIERYLGAISQVVLHEHRLTLHLICEQFTHDDIQKSYEHYGRIGGTIENNSQRREKLAVFLAKSLDRFGHQLQKAKAPLKRTMSNVCAYLLEHGDVATIPPSILEQTLDTLGEKNKTKITQKIVQQGLTLRVEDGTANNSKADDHKFTAPALVAEIQSTQKQPVLMQVAHNQASHIIKRGEFPEEIPSEFSIRTQFESLELRQQKATDFYWVKRLSVTREGVIAETEHLKLIWPNEPNKAFEFAKWGARTGAPHQGLGGGVMCLKPEAPEWLHQHRPQLDEFGLFTHWDIEGVNFKMRYIPPGTFLMGSPEDEPQRQDRELQHPVTLTQGYWLAETTVSQALWQAVMGDNPSNFKPEGDEQLPVESVSWNDCQVFCQKLNEITGVDFDLPTEAQWEYACRAGTQTPFNMGEKLYIEEVNYWAEHPYEGRVPLSKEEIKVEKENDRDRTVDIHQFKANTWGLKQMHGNVLEWCKDDWREYVAEAATDPVGPTLTRLAALRGGGCANDGQYCRSASRGRYVRDVRDWNIGLRVSQGIAPRASGSEENQ